MFFQPPEEESQNIIKPPQNNLRRRRKKKFSNQNKQAKRKEASNRKQLRFATTMSSWAESFTSAATWQLKHQIAYWKSRATALEYENKVLHGIIRDNYMNPSHAKDSHVSNSYPREMSARMENDDESDQDHEEEELEENDNFEVSEEFIQFLTENAKYKEDARKERERLKAKESEDNVEELEAGPPESHENNQEMLKELYGDKWKRISALETCLYSQFISNSDSDKPMYWPNIPFNFNFS